MKKNLLSLFLSMALIFSCGAFNAFALGYGEEWEHMENSTDKSGAVVQIETENSDVNAIPGTFSDVDSGHWAYKAVEKCKASQWLDGYPDGTFRPNGNITRAEAMKVFVTFLGLPLNDVTTSTYYDVEPTIWYAPYIEAGKELFSKRTALSGEEKFQPDMPITREDTIYALVKALGYDSFAKNTDESVLNMFIDKNSISSSLRQYVALAVSKGLASGFKEDSTIRAQDPLTRAQFATLLLRGVELGKNEKLVKKLKSIDVQPKTLQEMKVGDSFEITATATYTDNSTEDYTSKLNPYTDGIEGVITINKQKVTAVGAGTVVIQYNNDELRAEKLVVVVEGEPKVIVVEEIEIEEDAEGEVSGKVSKSVDVSDSLELYTVLVLDQSGSMYGMPIEALKKAAKNFCRDALAVKGESKVALVAYSYDAQIVNDFSNDYAALESKIDQFYANGTTNIADGLEKADSLLSNVADSDKMIKSIIVMSDGLPCEGKFDPNGPFNDGYANATVSTADNLKSKYNIYSLGFFHSLNSIYLSAGTALMEKIQNKGYYEVNDPDKLVNIFESISKKIIRNDARVELIDSDGKIAASSDTESDGSFKLTAKVGDYVLNVSSNGYKTVTKDITLKENEPLLMGEITLN